MRSKNASRCCPQARGFALVVSLTMMILLTMIAVGLLSLSAITLRTTSHSSAKAEAQANARLALMIAIGELQKQMGPDQRISANGDIIANTGVNHPHFTGVWDSWVAGPLADAPVNPDYPRAESHHQTINPPTTPTLPTGLMAPDYDKSKYFRAWLASLDPDETTDPTTPVTLDLDGVPMPDNEDSAIRLVGTGSLGNNAPATEFVSVRLMEVKSPSATSEPRGRYAWWVGDESQKARVMADSYDLEGGQLTAAQKINRTMAPGSMGNASIEGLDAANPSELQRVISLKTLDMLSATASAPGSGELSQRHFHHISPYTQGVLADVREGGLKRDLSTILEREINLAEDGDEFMLYRFGDDGDDRVPIQDLAAYFQLYQNEPGRSEGRRGGVEHNAGSAGAMQVNVPNYGNSSNREQFLREYTALYRNPVPVKVQFVLGVGATEITEEERDRTISRGNLVRDSDLYKMLLGIKPVVSLWNPNNVPMVMGTDASQIMKVSFPPFALRWRKYRSDGEIFTNRVYFNLSYGIGNSSNHDGRINMWRPYAMQLQFARNQPIVFQPGEVKQFSISIPPSNILENGGSAIDMINGGIYQAQEFVPDEFYVTTHSAVREGRDVAWLGSTNYRDVCLVFGDEDRIDFEVLPESSTHPETNTRRSLAISVGNEVRGGGFQFWMGAAALDNNQTAHFRNYQFISRFGGTPSWDDSPNRDFNNKLMLAGFPNRQPIPYMGETNAIRGSELLAATAAGEAKALLNFQMMAGCETHEISSGGAGAGRRITTRPFLHGSALSAPQITGDERADLYDYAWEWQVNRINALEEAFQDDGSSRGFYGGGYTVENGVTHVVQQYLPVLPPVSIASLSNARLGGFSLANAPVMSSGGADVAVGGGTASGDFIRDAPGSGDFRQVTATGQGGLAPHVLQAIGNSYAHPNIASDKAFTIKTQLLNMDTDSPSAPPIRPYADHSYLANKALWDEFFFSSITTQLSRIPLYGISSDKVATEVASDFLFNGTPLPNRRFKPYVANLTEDGLPDLLGEYTTYVDGFADKIASHMMVDGPFNINSTSVEAWRILFSSLKGISLSYLDESGSLAESVVDGVPASPGMLANNEPIRSDALGGDPNFPAEQWTSSRSLTDEEINDLAEAMVRQIKTRGPFLSLSEFINRSLDGPSSELALKSALQAAIDDDAVTINAAFREPQRRLDAEAVGMDVEFPQALQGPIAYGSTPYVDQADILRHFAGQLTPRGDTFVIRTYGDSLDATGNVVARAWCEAVVQRLPDYVDGGDEAHTRQADLNSTANMMFGRKFVIINFRWLSSSEI